jgi:hypothetical protein
MPQETISIPGQPVVFISNGKVVNGKQLKRYWRHELHRRAISKRETMEYLRMDNPEPPEPAEVNHVVVYEYSDITESNIQRIGKLEMEVRQLKEKSTFKKQTVKHTSKGIEL